MFSSVVFALICVCVFCLFQKEQMDRKISSSFLFTTVAGGFKVTYSEQVHFEQTIQQSI